MGSLLSFDDVNFGNLESFLNVFDELDVKTAQTVLNMSDFDDAVKQVIIGNSAHAASLSIVSDAQGKLSVTSSGLSHAFTGLGASLKALAVNPLTWVVVGVAGAVAAYDLLTVSANEANEAMEESFSAYEESKSKVESINSELDTASQRMDELNAKDSLSFIEEGELEKLKEATKELTLQKDLAEKEEARAAKEAAKDTAQAYEKNFGKYELSDELIDNYTSGGKRTLGSNAHKILSDNEKDLSSMFAALNIANERKKESLNAGNSENFNKYKEIIADIEASIWEQAGVLNDEYIQKLKAIPSSDLTLEQNSALNEAEGLLEFIYQKLDPAKLKQIKLDDILMSDDAFSKAKEELTEIAKSSENLGITVDDVKDKYPELAKAIEDADFDLKIEDLVGVINSEVGNIASGASNVEETVTSVESLTATLEGAITAQDNLNAAMAQSVSGKGMDNESVSNIIAGYGIEEDINTRDKLFKKTANGISLNSEALRELQAQQEKATKSEFADKIKDQYRELSKAQEELLKHKKGTSEYNTALNNLDNIQKEITSLEELSSQYIGLTSAYQKWVDAQSVGEEGDMYDSFQTAIERGKELYKEGLVGTNEFRAIANLFSYEDISTAPVEKLVQAYKDASPTIKKFFTEGSKGAKEFVDYLDNNDFGEWVNDRFTFKQDTDEDIAEKLGISVDGVQAVFRKLKDYGWDIDLGEVTISDFDLKVDNVVSEAEKAKEKIEETLDTTFYFDFQTTDINSINNQLADANDLLDKFKNSDGVIDVGVEGAPEAIEIFQALILRKQQAEKPLVMQVNTSGLSTSVGDQITKLQEFQVAYDGLRFLKEQQTAGISVDTTELKEAETAVTTIASELNGMDIETSLEIDTSSIDSIQESLNSIDKDMLIEVGVNTESLDVLEDFESKTVPVKTGEVDDSTVKKYKPETKIVPVKTGILDTSSLNVTLPTLTQRIKIQKEGEGKAQGNTHIARAHGTPIINSARFSDGVVGTARAHGTLGEKRDTTALRGELGEELVVFFMPQYIAICI